MTIGITGAPTKAINGIGVVTSHALIIKVNNVVVGAIQQWHPQATRDVSHVYELNATTSGAPVDIIPGNVKGLTINVNRYDIFNVGMEKAFSSTDLGMLCDQTAGFEVVEKWKFADRTDTWVYYNCWFTSLGRTMASTDERIVKVDATLIYLSLTKIP
jgi:hypothetical protein